MGGIDDDPFSGIEDAYEAWYRTPLGAFVIAEEERCLLDAMPAPPGRLVEVGAGTGWWTRILAARGFAVTAVEPSAAMRAAAAARPTPGTRWIAARGEDLPLPADSADVVLVMTALEFAEDPQRLLSEAWRVLAPGGTLIVGHLDPLSPWAGLYRRLGLDGVAPWRGARFHSSSDVERWVPELPACARRSCVHLAPDATAPFDAANRAAEAAGMPGALAVLQWRKTG